MFVHYGESRVRRPATTKHGDFGGLRQRILAVNQEAKEKKVI